MHNIKDIRDDIENFFKLILKRNIKIDKNNILELDKKSRKLLQEKENLEKEKKKISKVKDKSLFEKSKKISVEIDKLNSEQNLIKNKLDELLSNIPNLPLSDVPDGNDENSNVEIEKKGEIKDFKFKPKSHYDLGTNLNMLDFDLATKTTGTRFVFFIF